MTLYPYIIKRKEATMRDKDYNHEYIHAVQQKELLLVGFYLLYVLEWMVRLLQFGWHDAYYHISFEAEAYAHEEDFTYIQNRRRFGWIDYMFNR